MRGSVGDELVVGADSATIAVVEAAAIDGTGDGGIGAENSEPTAAVPKKCGVGEAPVRAGRFSRAASVAGMVPELAKLEAEAVIAAATVAALGFGARRRRRLRRRWSRS